uniref:Uncharacterized protein n=1 Tax=Setaria italica TaxID=4555 RepID=K3YLZ0_SETIT
MDTAPGNWLKHQHSYGRVVHSAVSQLFF